MLFQLGSYQCSFFLNFENEAYPLDLQEIEFSDIADAERRRYAVFPDAIVQTCIVHLLRNSMNFVSWKDRKSLATALKEICRATDANTAEKALTAFEAGPWGTRYPAIGQSWRRAWAEVIPFFAFPDEVRRIIYTTNAIEALNSKLRRAVRARGHFPSDEAATKLLYLILDRS